MCSCGVFSEHLPSEVERRRWQSRHVKVMVIADRERERLHPLHTFNHPSGIRPIINVYLPGDAPR